MPIPFYFSPVLAAAAEDIRDIRGPMPLNSAWINVLWVLAVLLIIAGVAAWMRHLQHRRNQIPFREPHEMALDQLNEALKLLKPGNAREFSIAVSSAVRNYIEARFRLGAAHRTTEEFLHQLASDTASPLSPYSDSLNGFLYHCDLAKFARWELNVEEMRSMHASARKLVEDTQPRPEREATPAAR